MKLCRVLILGIFFCCMIFPPQFSVAGNGEKGDFQYGLLFVPFDGTDAGEYSFLRQSLQEMLISRLAEDEQVRIIENNLSDMQLDQLRKRGELADNALAGNPVFLVGGSLFAKDGELQVEVVVDPLTKAAQKRKGNTSLRFSKRCSRQTMLGDISSLANDISQRLFQTKAAAGKYAEEGTEAFTTSHPEEAYKRGKYLKVATVNENSGFDIVRIGPSSRFTFKEDLLRVYVIDIDGDLREEVVLFFPHKIEIRRFAGTQFPVVDSFQLPLKLRVHAVNIADIDKDGRQEIFLSATKGLHVSSAVLSWTEKSGFSWRAKNIRYYVRPVVLPGHGVCLAAQGRGVARTALRKPSVFLADLTAAGILELKEKLVLPESVHLFDFYYADLDGDGADELVVIDSLNHLNVFDSNNILLWQSEKLYAGSKVYIGPDNGSAVDEQSTNTFSVEEDADRELLYVPGRIEVIDIDSDGRQEIIVSESSMANIGLFVRLRPYTSGKISGMRWNGQIMQPFWETESFRGYLSDFTFVYSSDKDNKTNALPVNSATGRLYVASLPTGGGLFSFFSSGDNSVLTFDKIQFSFKENE